MPFFNRPLNPEDFDPAGAAATVAGELSSAFTTPSDDRVIYVSAAGSDVNSGLALGQAKATIANALATLGGPGTVRVGSGSFPLGAGAVGVALTAQQRIIGNGRRNTRLTYTGTGAAIANPVPGTIQRMVHLEGFQLDIATGGAGAVGIKAENWYMATVVDVEVTIGTVAGVGVHIPGSGSPYFGDWRGLIVSSAAPVHASSVGIKIDAGVNAHTFAMATVHNCATGLLLAGDTCHFVGLQTNDCTVNHLDISGRWNHFYGLRVESSGAGTLIVRNTGAGGTLNQVLGYTISGTVTVTEQAGTNTMWIGPNAASVNRVKAGRIERSNEAASLALDGPVAVTGALSTTGAVTANSGAAAALSLNQDFIQFVGSNADGNVYFRGKGAGAFQVNMHANSGTGGFIVGNGAASPTAVFSVGVTGTITIAGNIAHQGANIGFFGTTATSKKTVTGSRGGNAALASLLTQLATYGLIVDSTTA